MTDETLYVIGDLIMFTSIIGTLVFAGSYAFFFAWRKTAAGRSLMYFVLSLAAWAVQSFAARMDPDYPGRGVTRIFVYSLIAVTVWRLVVTLWWSWKHTPFEVEPRKKDSE